MSQQEIKDNDENRHLAHWTMWGLVVGTALWLGVMTPAILYAWQVAASIGNM